jgi:hypothetical protein
MARLSAISDQARGEPQAPWTRLRRRRVSAEKKVSTAFSREPEAGVKWEAQR